MMLRILGIHQQRFVQFWCSSLRLGGVRRKHYTDDLYLTPILGQNTYDYIQEQKEIATKVKYGNFSPLPSMCHCGIFNHPRLMTFMNYVMIDFNKALAYELMRMTFENIKKNQLRNYRKAETEEERNEICLDPMQVFLSAIENVRPYINTVEVYKGGIKYQAPAPLNEKQSYFKGMKWLVEAGRDRPSFTIHFPEQMAKELIDAHNNRGRVVQRKIDLHKLCEANKAYTHFRGAR